MGEQEIHIFNGKTFKNTMYNTNTLQMIFQEVTVFHHWGYSHTRLIF